MSTYLPSSTSTSPPQLTSLSPLKGRLCRAMLAGVGEAGEPSGMRSENRGSMMKPIESKRLPEARLIEGRRRSLLPLLHFCLLTPSAFPRPFLNTSIKSFPPHFNTTIKTLPPKLSWMKGRSVLGVRNLQPHQHPHSPLPSRLLSVPCPTLSYPLFPRQSTPLSSASSLTLSMVSSVMGMRLVTIMGLKVGQV